MPRIARSIPGGLCAHVMTRGNAKATIFHAEAEYEEFTVLIEGAQARIPLELFAWCLMPNHLHLVVRPKADRDLGRWIHWLLTTHVQRYRARYSTTGHIWQGRYKAFPVQADKYLVTLLRYVERNAVRAGLVASAIDWRWTSARERQSSSDSRGLLSPSPVPLPDPWIDWVNKPLTGTEISRVRRSVSKNRPLGDESWTLDVARRLGVLGTLRPRGRPKATRCCEKGDCPLF